MASSKYIKNDSGSTSTYNGQAILNGEYYLIQAEEEARWASTSELLSDIGSGDAKVAYDNSGSNDIAEVNEAIDYLKCNFAAEVHISGQPPFADKNVDDKKLYNRSTGKIFTLSAGSNTCDFTIAYPHVKIVGVEIINGGLGDYTDFTVHDDALGTYSTVANYQLNQFGFDVNVAPDKYERMCKYDADLYYGMVIKMTYTAAVARDIYVNYILHELKT